MILFSSLFGYQSYVCACVNHSVMSNSLWPHRLWPTRFLCPWNSPEKNIGIGCHSLHKYRFPTLLGFVFVHMLNVINERSREDGVIRHFSLTSLTDCLIFFFPSEHAGQVSRTQFKCCLARLVWSEEGPVPLTPSPHASSTSPQIQDAHPPPEGGSWERTPKYEWLFQASVAVETGCTGLGGPLYHPQRRSQWATSSIQASPPHSCPATHQWAGLLA